MRKWHIYDGLVIVGGICLVGGVGWIYLPAGGILAGVLLMALGILLDMANGRRPNK